jgi:hypothetical protein
MRRAKEPRARPHQFFQADGHGSRTTVLRNNVAHSVAGSRDFRQTIFMVQSGQNRRRLNAVPVGEMMPGRLWPV